MGRKVTGGLGNAWGNDTAEFGANDKFGRTGKRICWFGNISVPEDDTVKGVDDDISVITIAIDSSPDSIAIMETLIFG